MKGNETMKTLTNTIYPAFTLFALASFALSPARAQCPQGCDVNDNTFLGSFAFSGTGSDNTAIGYAGLHYNTTGSFNTAIGSFTLTFNTTGLYNTANGFQALLNNTTGSDNTATGVAVLYANTTGSGNTANGFNALLNNATGSLNTATGALALLSNTTGYYNTATGGSALTFNTTGNYNTADGVGALRSNTTGLDNVANGYQALWANTIGNYNTATGVQALTLNTTGDGNIANGHQALYNNDTGGGNTANGFQALYGNTIGNYNTANGYQALYHNTTGNYNAATGASALTNNTTGNFNTATGLNALRNNMSGSNNTAVGVNALLSCFGSNNVSLGFNAGHDLVVGNGNVCIGAAVVGVAGESNTTRIRNIYSSVASARAVYVNSDNKIGTLASTRRVKDNIKPMDKASEAILALKPVSFRYKKEIDASGAPQFGLIAEEVADLNADLVTRDSDGKPETVRYEAVNAMLLNEFLKEHSKVESLEKAMAEQQKESAVMRAMLKEQAAQIQKVSAQLATSNGAAGMRSDMDGPSREAAVSGSEQVNPSRGGLEVNKPTPRVVTNKS